LNASETPWWLIVHFLLASALMFFFAILWRFALKRYSSASFLEGTYFLLHGYPIASTCSPASLETVGRMSDLSVERMAKSKAQEEDGSSENGQLDTGDFEKPELLSSSIEDGDEKLPPFLGKQKSKLLQLRDSLLDLMTGVSRDTLRSPALETNAAKKRGARQLGTLRVNLRRFPYHFLFRIVGDSVRILVVRHDRRHPSFGIRRR
jgi:hypothetical protein